MHAHVFNEFLINHFKGKSNYDLYSDLIVIYIQIYL